MNAILINLATPEPAAKISLQGSGVVHALEDLKVELSRVLAAKKLAGIANAALTLTSAMTEETADVCRILSA